MQSLKRLIGELHRRSLWQVLTVYLVGSWIGYEVVLGLYEGIGLPAWVPGLAIVLFIVGLPVVLATAFVQEGGPTRRGGDGRAAGPVEGLEGLEQTMTASERRDTAAVRALAEPGPGPRSGSGLAALLTWNRAIVGGVLAFALLGLGTVGSMGLRSLGVGPAGTLIARGVIEARTPLVLADFENVTGEAGLGDVVTDALRIDLLASPVIRLVEDAEIRDALGLMRSDATRLSEELARELALRGGYKGLIVGEVAAVGAGYVLTARVISTAAGETLAGFRETAATPEDLLPAIDRLSESVRAKIGESLKSARAGEPLDRVTTSSLDALRKYSQADRLVTRSGSYLRAIALLEEAVAMDTAFAMAWRKLGAYYANAVPEDGRRVEAMLRAYQFRDRLNERERALAEGTYHLHVTRDNNAAIRAYENLLAVYPDDDVAVNNLALAYNNDGRYQDVVELMASRRAQDALHPSNYANLLAALVALDRREEIDEVLETVSHDFAGTWRPLYYRMRHAGLGDRGAGRRLAGMMMDSFPNQPLAVGRARAFLTYYAAAEGRVERHAAGAGELARLAAATGFRAFAAQTLAQVAVTYAETLSDPEAVEAAIQELHDRIDLDSLSAVDRPYDRLARARARAGDPDRAERLLDEAEREIPEALHPVRAPERAMVRGLIASARGDHGAAIQWILEARPSLQCGPCGLDQLGLVYERAGNTDAAIAAYTAYIEMPHRDKSEHDQTALAFSLERLAILHDQRGDVALATQQYAAFIDLWGSADPVLQPRVATARSRLAAIAGERQGRH